MNPLGSFSVGSTYIWGIDLSGNLQDAGGVAGLLSQSLPSSGESMAPTFDGNGNVYAMTSRSSGGIRAVFEYSPFGETLRASGSSAAQVPIRFSTKYTDQETQLIYYGFRYFDAHLGRFVGRDPVSERGGLNLYAACSNNLLNSIDYIGLKLVRYISGYQTSYDGTVVESNAAGGEVVRVKWVKAPIYSEVEVPDEDYGKAYDRAAQSSGMDAFDALRQGRLFEWKDSVSSVADGIVAANALSNVSVSSSPSSSVAAPNSTVITGQAAGASTVPGGQTQPGSCAIACSIRIMQGRGVGANVTESSMVADLAARTGRTVDDVNANGLRREEVKTSLKPLLASYGLNVDVNSIYTNTSDSYTAGKGLAALTAALGGGNPIVGAYYVGKSIPMDGSSLVRYQSHAVILQSNANGGVDRWDPERGVLTPYQNVQAAYNDLVTGWNRTNPNERTYVIVPVP